MNIISLCSGGGGTLQKLVEVVESVDMETHVEFEVIADRDCGAFAWAKDDSRIKAMRIDWDADQEKLRAYLERQSPCIVLTFVHRILRSELLSIPGVRYINTHYSLLPSFVGTIGMRSVKRAIDTGCLILGATSHEVTEELDAGPILSQVAFARRDASFEETCEAMFECGCLTTIMAISRAPGWNSLFEKAEKKYGEQIRYQIITGKVSEN